MVQYCRLFNVFKAFFCKIGDLHGDHICQDPDKVIFNFSSYNLNDHKKLVLCKGLNFAIPPKAIEYSELLLLCEMLFREITSSDVGDCNKECQKQTSR